MAATFEQLAYKTRTQDFSISLYEADGTTGVGLESGDRVRVKIGRGDAATPTLDLVSGTATANGSKVTVNSLVSPAAITLRLAQGDLALMRLGPYDVNVLVVDDSETAPADAIKHAQYGVLHVVGSLGGNVSL